MIVVGIIVLLAIVAVWVAFRIGYERGVKDERKRKLALLFAAAVPSLFGAEFMGPPARPKLLTAADAHQMAQADLRTLPPEDRIYTRYVWISDGRKEAVKVTGLTLNYVSRAGTIARFPLVGGALLRVDLRRLAPRDADLAEWLTFWEEFAFDPSFSTLITKDAIEAEIRRGIAFADVVEVGTKKLRVKCKPYTLDGQTFDTRWVSAIRFSGRHLDSKIAADLELSTGSLAPVVEHRYLTFRALSTVKDQGTYALVFGGLYYELAGIKKAKAAGKKKATDEDLLFESVGIGDVDKGLTASGIFERLRSDQRTAMFRSKVTGKPRRVDVLPSLSGRGNQGFLIVTHDIKDGDVDVGTHPLMNLVDFKDAAREDIFTRANGLHGFALFNGDGGLQDEAPPDVVKDHQIPAPHTARLQGAISCVRCHGIDGSDGLKPLTNDVQMLRKGYLDVFGDTTDLGKSIPDVLDRLAGQYAGSPDKTLRRGREDYIEAILRATGPWDGAKDQTEVGKLSALEYERMFREFWYEPVDAQKALRDLGHEVAKDKAVEMFRKVVPPDKSRLEDPRIGALAMGLEISRSDWSLALSFAATRAKEAKEKR